MSSLLEKKCTACELGAPLVPEEKQNDLLKDLKGWLIAVSYTHLTLPTILRV